MTMRNIYLTELWNRAERVWMETHGIISTQRKIVSDLKWQVAILEAQREHLPFRMGVSLRYQLQAARPPA